MTLFKIYGERNTGTTYLEQLIKKNIKCKTLSSRPPFLIRKIQNLIPFDNELIRDFYFSKNKSSLGWKHALVDKELIFNAKYDYKKLIILTVTKNPYSWLLSMYRRPYHAAFRPRNGKIEQSFSEFLERRWDCVKRENYKKGYVNSPVDLWNLKNSAYIKISKSKSIKVFNLKYEDLLNDYKGLISNLSKVENLKLLDEKIYNIDDSAKGDDVKFFDYKNYYINEEWRKNINHEQYKLINSKLDVGLMKTFDYEIIDS